MHICSLNLSLVLGSPLFSNIGSGRCWLMIQNWRIAPQNSDPLLRIEVLHGLVILALEIELIERSVLIISSNSWIFWLVLSSLDPLCPLVGFRPPSKIPSFSHSASLSLLHLYRTLSKTQFQKAFSLYAGVTIEVNSPATPRGIQHSAGARKSWFLIQQLSFSLSWECQTNYHYRDFIPAKRILTWQWI